MRQHNANFGLGTQGWHGACDLQRATPGYVRIRDKEALMSSPRCTEPSQGAAEMPDSGRPGEGDWQFVGRTSVPAIGRALVPTTVAPPSEAVAASQPASATFLAQLIATAQQAPQTRARRRAEPEHARAVYDATVARCIDVGGTACRGMWA